MEGGLSSHDIAYEAAGNGTGGETERGGFWELKRDLLLLEGTEDSSIK